MPLPVLRDVIQPFPTFSEIYVDALKALHGQIDGRTRPPADRGGIVMTATTTQREPELRGQTVVVIGGSSGIGLETARRARAEGAGVILTGRNADTSQAGRGRTRRAEQPRPSTPPTRPPSSGSSPACPGRSTT